MLMSSRVLLLLLAVGALAQRPASCDPSTCASSCPDYVVEHDLLDGPPPTDTNVCGEPCPVSGHLAAPQATVWQRLGVGRQRHTFAVPKGLRRQHQWSPALLTLHEFAALAPQARTASTSQSPQTSRATAAPPTPSAGCAARAARPVAAPPPTAARGRGRQGWGTSPAAAGPAARAWCAPGWRRPSRSAAAASAPPPAKRPPASTLVSWGTQCIARIWRPRSHQDALNGYSCAPAAAGVTALRCSLRFRLASSLMWHHATLPCCCTALQSASRHRCRRHHRRPAPSPTPPAPSQGAARHHRATAPWARPATRTGAGAPMPAGAAAWQTTPTARQGRPG